MKQVIYLLMLPLLMVGCKSNLAKKSTADTTEADPSKMECIPTQYTYGYNNNFDPGTFGKTTYVYNSIKPAARVIDTLPFNVSVNILKEYPDLFLVCTPKAKSGYVKKTDIYFHSVFWGYKRCTYLFGIDKYPKPKDNQAGDFTACDASGLKVIKLSPTKKVLDVYHDSIQGAHYELKLIYNSALKNADAVFYLNYHCYSEIGITADHFIVDNGTKLSRLLIAGGEGDGGSSGQSTVYLPVNLINSKKIVLAKNGIISVDDNTAKVELYPYPANCGIPINELIVVEDTSTETVDDESGQPTYDSDGTLAKKITINQTTYYRWDGNTLRTIKIIKGK